jgi:hypothetical protein
MARNKAVPRETVNQGATRVTGGVRNQASFLVRARKETSEDLPEYLALGDEKLGVAVSLKITSVGESPFYFVDED